MHNYLDNREEIKLEIVRWMKKNALGRENAKPRRLLLAHLYYIESYDISDRTLRRYYATMPIGLSVHDPKGVYWITGKDDLNATTGELGGKARGCWERVEAVKNAVRGPGARQLKLGGVRA